MQTMGKGRLMIDLQAKDREAICALAEETLPEGAEIWAYGSRVKGSNHEASDLDLAVHFPPELDFQERVTHRAKFLEALQESNIPIIVQVMSWQDIPESFRANIQQCYEVLWP